jgi:hypothetical protein
METKMPTIYLCRKVPRIAGCQLRNVLFGHSVRLNGWCQQKYTTTTPNPYKILVIGERVMHAENQMVILRHVLFVSKCCKTSVADQCADFRASAEEVSLADSLLNFT